MPLVEKPHVGVSSLPDRYWHDDEIDWPQLADDMAPGSDISGTVVTYGGHGIARSALALLFGDAFWTAAARRSIVFGPVDEPALSVLRLVRPAVAVDECLRTLSYGPGGERLSALHLLADLADASHLDLVPELLSDRDPDIQTWAAVLLRNILYSGDVDHRTTEVLIRQLERHPNQAVREVAENI